MFDHYTDARQGRSIARRAMRFGLLFTTASAAALCSISSANAQGSGGGALALEEIVVTAQRREQRLQDVPVSVSVVSSDELLARNENEISALTKFDSSLTFQPGTQDQDAGVRVRGVGTNNFSRGVEQSVAVMVDGVVAANANAALLDLSDVERIEVLRGPQGILFGKNASAGLINIVTGMPTVEPEFGAGISWAEKNQIKIDAHASGAIIGDTLTGRISFYQNTRDALYENVFTGPGAQDLNDRNEWGVRGKLRWAPSDRFDALLTIAHSERDALCCTLGVPLELVPGGLAESLGAPSGTRNDKTFSQEVSRTGTNLETYALEMNYDLGDNVPDFLAGSTLTSITGLQKVGASDDFRTFDIGDISFLPLNRGQTDTTQWTQELRLTSPGGRMLDYVAGVYIYNSSLDRQFDQKVDFYATGGADAPGQLGTSQSRFVGIDNESYAAFANLTWNIAHNARISAGGRVQHDKADIYSTIDKIPGAFVVDVRNFVGDREASRSDDALSWRLVGEYNVSEDVLTYASVTRGYKGMAVNALGSFFTDPQPIINPEVPTSYEAGFKSELLGRRLRFNAAGFYTNFKDFQASSIDGTVEPAQFYIRSAGKLETYGLELNVAATPVEGLRLTGGLTWQQATFKEFTGAACGGFQTAEQGCIGGVQDLSGTDLPYAPNLSYNVTARYDQPLDAIPYTAYILGSWVWTDDFITAGGDPLAHVDSHGIADFHLGLNANDGRFSMEFFVKNLFDKFYASAITTGTGFAGIRTRQTLPYDYERRFGVSARFNF